MFISAIIKNYIKHTAGRLLCFNIQTSCLVASEQCCNIRFLPIKYVHALKIVKEDIHRVTQIDTKRTPLSTTDEYLPNLSRLLKGRGLFLSFTLHRRAACVIVRRRSIQDTRARRKGWISWRRRWRRARARSGGGCPHRPRLDILWWLCCGN